MGIAGVPWWTTDIGGFHGGDPNDPKFRELFARWFEWGAFCPVMRTLFYMYPDDPVCWETEDEYFYGPDVLVAPVLYAGQRSRTVYLPKEEQWIDYTTGKEYEGGQTIEADAPLNTIPVFIKKDSNVFGNGDSE